MRKRLKLGEKLTYANVTATLCLFLLLGGGAAYGAVHLGKNSVGTKQIKKNAVTAAKIRKNAVTAKKIKKNAVITEEIRNEAVTAAKIKNGTITGAQINLASLGTVPSATNATNAQTLDGQSATQLASASKLHCPSGMKLYAGLCFQEAANSAKEWSSAAIGCWQQQLRLPTVGELVGFEYNNYTAQPVGEWTEPQWFDGSETVAWVASGFEHGTSWGTYPASESEPYRCVTSPSN